MIKVEKPPGIAVRYNWRLIDLKKDAVVLSKKIKYEEKDSFRIALKNLSPPSSPILLFFTTNLNKLGLKATGVNFSSENDPKIKQMASNISRKEDENGALQMFTATLQDIDVANSKISFIFTVYLTGIVENYRVYEMDDLLSQQLLLSIKNQHLTDIKLTSKDGKMGYSVYKWMLAARSPVFATLLNKEDVKPKLTLNYTLDEIRQLVNFIYTGEFDAPVNDRFTQIACKYKVKTLESLNRAASEDLTADKMATLAFNLKPGTHPLCNAETSKPDSDKEIITQDENTSMFKITWKVDHWIKENQGDIKEELNIAASEAFEHGGHKCFRAEFKTWKRISNFPSKPKFTLRFLSYGHSNISSSIEDVTFSIGQDDNNSATPEQQLYKMNENQTLDKKLLQLFTLPSTDLTNPPSFPFFVTFNVKLNSTIPNFTNKIIDIHWSEELWAASVNRTMTDVKLLVEEMTYAAHRSLLSARSPVFAAMFASGMTEVETGQVRIEDVDYTTFKHFLKFLYTGMVEPSSMDRELFKVADKYQVETLMELCRPASQTVDVDDIFKTFLSC